MDIKTTLENVIKLINEEQPKPDHVKLCLDKKTNNKKMKLCVEEHVKEKQPAKEVEDKPKGKRGRPAKEKPVEDKPKGKRGRPAKEKPVEDKPKGKRGRPAKEKPVEDKPKGKRGRPAKEVEETKEEVISNFGTEKKTIPIFTPKQKKTKSIKPITKFKLSNEGKIIITKNEEPKKEEPKKEESKKEEPINPDDRYKTKDKYSNMNSFEREVFLYNQPLDYLRERLAGNNKKLMKEIKSLDKLELIPRIFENEKAKFGVIVPEITNALKKPPYSTLIKDKPTAINQVFKQYMKDISPDKVEDKPKGKRGRPAKDKPVEDKPVEETDEELELGEEDGIEFFPFSFSVKTKEQMGKDAFNFSRDFKYFTTKTDEGYDFIFNNQKDLATAIDLTMYVMDYKNPKLYKWNYNKVPSLVLSYQSGQPKPEPEPVPKPEPKPKPKPEPDTDLKNIVENWDDPNISILLYQSVTYRPFMEFIEKLIEKGKAIANSQLFFNKEYKELLNKLVETYGLKKVDEVITDIVKSSGGKSIKDLDSYYGNLNARNQKKMIEDKKKETKKEEPAEEAEEKEADQSKVFDDSLYVADYIIEPLPIISKKIELKKINDKFKGIDKKIEEEKKEKLKNVRDKLTEEIQKLRVKYKPLMKGLTDKQMDALLNKEDKEGTPFRKESDKQIKELKKKYDKLIEDNSKQYNKELDAFDKRDLDQEVVDLLVGVFKNKVMDDKTISIMDNDMFKIVVDGESVDYSIMDIMDYMFDKYNELKGTDYKSRQVFDEDMGQELINFYRKNKKMKKGGQLTASISRGRGLVRSDRIRGGEMTASISRGRGLVRSDMIRGGIIQTDLSVLYNIPRRFL